MMKFLLLRCLLLCNITYSAAVSASDLKKEVKTIDIKKLDFSKNSSVKFLDIHTKSLGEVNKDFKVLTLSKNNEYVEKGFPIGYDNKEFGTSECLPSLRVTSSDSLKIFFQNK
jgi:hypothetical protein